MMMMWVGYFDFDDAQRKKQQQKNGCLFLCATPHLSQTTEGAGMDKGTR